MKILKISIYCFIFYSISLCLNVYSNPEIKKIDDLLKSNEKLFKAGVLDEDTYNKSREKLVNQKEEIQSEKKVNTPNPSLSKTLEKQLEVVKKLFDDGVLSEDEYQKTKEFLEKKEEAGENINLNNISSVSDYELIVKKKKGRKNWENAELIYKDYKIETYRPGGIRVIRISDNKKLLQITDNYKIKYFNNGKSVLTIKKTVYQVDRAKNPDDLVKNIEKDVGKSLSDLGELLSNPIDKLFNKNKKKPIFDKESHKLELFIEGKKILQYEGRYVKKHRAFFYQVLTPRYEPFHYYIRLTAKSAIALNMEFFNAKIDKAVRKAKKRLAAEYNITEQQIEKIIEKKIGEETDKAVERSMEEVINKSVVEAIEQTVGEVMSATLINAIEQATGEAIEESIETELAAAIDAEIAYAVSMGIDEAAVTAGWQAYFEVLAQGGSLEQASDAAYKACGSACDNY